MINVIIRGQATMRTNSFSTMPVNSTVRSYFHWHNWVHWWKNRGTITLSSSWTATSHRLSNLARPGLLLSKNSPTAPSQSYN